MLALNLGTSKAPHSVLQSLSLFKPKTFGWKMRMVGCELIRSGGVYCKELQARSTNLLKIKVKSSRSH